MNSIKNVGLSLIVFGVIIILSVLILVHLFNYTSIEATGIGLILIGIGIFLVRPQKKELITFKEKIGCKF